MSSSRDFFIKSQKYHHKGQINKALEFCEKAISQDIKNVDALNLKGFLHYYLGDIDTAKAVWGTNKDFNNDPSAKGYLSNLNNEEELLKLYIDANKYIQEYRIKEALVLLEQCKESSFNTINVNCSLAKCYAYMGRNEEVKKALSRVFQLDKNNEFGKEISKSLVDLDNSNKPQKLIYGVMFLVILVVVAASIPVINIYNKKQNESSISKSNKEDIVIENAKEENQESNKDNQEEKAKESKPAEVPVKEVFPAEELKKAIDNKDYYKLYNLNEKWKAKDKNLLSDNEKSLLIKSEEILIKDGVPEFYDKGLKYIDSKDNIKAIEVLNMALVYSNGSYLGEHILYFLSSCYVNQGENEKAIKTSEEYINLYKDGVYIRQVLYNLVLLNKDKDITKAKNYANEIINKYSDSQFNNDIVKGVANR